MTNLKIRNILISDLKLFLIKGAPFEENETCFLYKGVSYTREPTVPHLLPLPGEYLFQVVEYKYHHFRGRE